MVAEMSAPVLQTHSLVKRFGGITATQNVSLSVRAGARHALIGPNGAGKTTLINQLTGVLAPTSGSVVLEGVTSRPCRPTRALVWAWCTFQINQLFASLTPTQALALAVSSRRGLAHRFWRPLGQSSEVAADVEGLLQQFRLTELAERPTRELPHGKRRLLRLQCRGPEAACSC